MSINNIDDTYTKLIINITSKTNRVVDNINTDGITTNSNNKTKIDQIEISSDESELASYLNYSASGRYNLPTLADYLNTDQSDSFSDDSSDGMFDSLIEQRSIQTDFLIQQALNRLSSKSHTTNNINTKNIFSPKIV